jgi:hypothetical protein
LPFTIPIQQEALLLTSETPQAPGKQALNFSLLKLVLEAGPLVWLLELMLLLSTKVVAKALTAQNAPVSTAVGFCWWGGLLPLSAAQTGYLRKEQGLPSFTALEVPPRPQ